MRFVADFKVRTTGFPLTSLSFGLDKFHRHLQLLNNI